MKFTRELTNGIIIFLGIGIYFLILDFLKLSDLFILRIFNILIVAYGVNRSIKSNQAEGIRGYYTNFISG